MHEGKWRYAQSRVANRAKLGNEKVPKMRPQNFASVFGGILSERISSIPQLSHWGVNINQDALSLENDVTISKWIEDHPGVDSFVLSIDSDYLLAQNIPMLLRPFHGKWELFDQVSVPV